MDKKVKKVIFQEDAGHELHASDVLKSIQRKIRSTRQRRKENLPFFNETSNFFMAAFVLAADDLVTGKKGEGERTRFCHIQR